MFESSLSRVVVSLLHMAETFEAARHGCRTRPSGVWAWYQERAYSRFFLKEHRHVSPSPFWALANLKQNRLNIIHGGAIASMVDLGGSLAVASRGLYATGVSTDLNGMRRNSLHLHETNILTSCSVTYLNSGGQVGDILKAVVSCDKC